ncbi:hypothetical protein FOCC_FOCC005445 [Frankliniella occidentalis]|nr:hypothetical protein FOCC_FOCC005445 [Frankliniella occidentalis]
MSCDRFSECDKCRVINGCACVSARGFGVWCLPGRYLQRIFTVNINHGGYEQHHRGNGEVPRRKEVEVALVCHEETVASSR